MTAERTHADEIAIQWRQERDALLAEVAALTERAEGWVQHDTAAYSEALARAEERIRQVEQRAETVEADYHAAEAAYTLEHAKRTEAEAQLVTAREALTAIAEFPGLDAAPAILAVREMAGIARAALAGVPQQPTEPPAESPPKRVCP